jgi:hypothetical protein
VYYTDDYRFEEFRALVLTELRLRHAPFERAALYEFMRAMRAMRLLVTDDDSPQWWADAFLEAHPAGRAEVG